MIGVCVCVCKEITLPTEPPVVASEAKANLRAGTARQAETALREPESCMCVYVHMCVYMCVYTCVYVSE